MLLVILTVKAKVTTLVAIAGQQLHQQRKQKEENKKEE